MNSSITTYLSEWETFDSRGSSSSSEPTLHRIERLRGYDLRGYNATDTYGSATDTYSSLSNSITNSYSYIENDKYINKLNSSDTTTDTLCWAGGTFDYGTGTFKADPKAAIKDIIRSRQAPRIHTSRTPMRTAGDIREERARKTLRRVLGESLFRSFLRNGFVTVRGKSGKVYTIQPGSGFTAVYQNGKQIEKLCVVMTGDFPPTDSLIMRYLLILNDEEHFRGLAHKWAASGPRGRSLWPEIKIPKGNPRSLVEIYRELKAA